MVNKLRIFMVVGLTLVAGVMQAQTTRDSSNAEITKQAVEMRETLNKYLADKLLIDDKKGASSTTNSKVVDSILALITKQQHDLENLRKALMAVEQKVDNVGKKQQTAETEAILSGGLWRVSENQLNVYFPFDGAQLTPHQIAAIHRFIGKRKIKTIHLTGFTDWIGTEKHNYNLAVLRTKEVKRVIERTEVQVKSGVDIGCKSSDPNGASLCRKVEIVLHR